VLQFSVEGVSCAITVGKTAFVERMVRIIPPSVKKCGIAGTIDLHGRTVPVYQIRTLLGFPNRKPHLSDVLIVTKAGSGCVALWVDEISGISPYTSLDPEDISAYKGEKGEPVVPGVTITPEGLVIIHELEDFLKNPNPDQILSFLPPQKGAYEISGDEGEERVTTILSERAQKLSQPAAKTRGIERVDVLKFRLAYQEYAIGMKYVREVVLTGGITPVPGAPEYISGICAIRGEIISLVDLRALFSISGRGLTDLNRVIVVTDGTMTFGILADYITGITTIPANLPVVLLPDADPETVPYLLGVVEGIVVLDGRALLTDPRMLIDETTA
jgi:chemotaxis signal transduction protein